MEERGAFMQYKLLAVDDEEYILKLLKDYFTMQGYLVYTAKTVWRPWRSWKWPRI